MKYYITKYVLTKGILEVEGKLCAGGIILDKSSTRSAVGIFISNKYFHENLEDAIIRAKEMINNRIKSLNKQIDKFKNLDLEVKN